MSQPKVLIIVGDATETVDTLYPFYRLVEGGYQPVVAAPEKRLYQMVLHEVKPGWTITKEWEGYSIEADVAFRDIKEADYAGIFFSGGRAPEYIRYDQDLVRVTRHFFETGKPIASVCHGVEIPAYANCVKGRRMVTVPTWRRRTTSRITRRAGSPRSPACVQPATTTGQPGRILLQVVAWPRLKLWSEPG